MDLQGNPAPEKARLEQIRLDIGPRLSDEIWDFYRQYNGADISTDNNYLVIWPLEELESLNVLYTSEGRPDSIYLFGSDGGGEGFGCNQHGAIYQLPFIGMEFEEPLLRGRSFTQFLATL